jgi:hypothetical protein
MRTGDKYIKGQLMNSNTLHQFKNIILERTFPDRKYLIISDCNILKTYLKTNLPPNFYIYIKKIQHLGGEAITSITDDSVMNTMLDFFIMEHSNSILSLSVYDHVSGFSKYISIMNNIPFKFIQV